MKASELAAKAADEVERRGLFKGNLGSSRLDIDNCQVCALGAIGAAGTGDPWLVPNDIDSYYAVRTELVTSLPPRFISITGWSDHDRTTGREVVDTFRAVSVKLAARGE